MTEQLLSIESKVHLEKLSVGYREKTILTDISFNVTPGEIVTLIGPNGAGKSTILKTISKQLEPVSGSVYIDSRDIARVSYRELAQKISILLTDRINPELMTARDIVESGRYPFTGHMGILSDEDHRIVEETVNLCNISKLADKYYRELSDGQKQRVLLARAIAQTPEILILDEPTSYLDIKYKLDLLKMLRVLASEKNISIIMSLHEFELARIISDTIVCVKDDNIYKAGTPEDILDRTTLQELYDISDENYDMLLQSIGCML
ncbi:ABC transporter ATP-binding protein [Oribacterium sp. WCC10]|uniref:ABC transporter ATP-binding protein n=1 Tax=Oribacterium sp. WCC10 TaxID=1855343 RepID=UPI0008E92152|nr:ABC transporter ATP-binding protein [Oribacterium sp. WCC10]SFG75349.1 iron complex transport system ATP-binding protein [Oribacterium sp. WCC10]